MNTAVATYMLYLVISIGLTVWVGHTLHKNGAHFLMDVFKGNTELAKAVNHLLVVGFYLINLGYVSLSMTMSEPPDTPQGAIESLSLKIGAVLIALGGLHLTNVYVLNRLRSRSNEPRQAKRPVQPNYQWAGYGPGGPQQPIPGA